MEVLFKLSDVLNIELEELCSPPHASSLDELDEYYDKMYKEEQTASLNYAFKNIEDLIDVMVKSRIFSKEFKINYEELETEKQEILKSDIYKSMEWICYRLNNNK